MGRMTAERREEKFALMRARQKFLEEARLNGDNAVRAPSEDTLRRKEKLKQNPVPAHLQMYRVQEVAQMLGLSRQTIHREFLDRAVKVVGGQKTILLISRQALEDWIREHT